MTKRHGWQLSAFYQVSNNYKRRGEVFLTTILTIVFLSTVLVCQYRCYQIEQENFLETENQITHKIRTNLSLMKRHD